MHHRHFGPVVASLSPGVPMNASTVSALLAQRAEAVCRQYLPNGKKQGRYWCAGDARGAKGRSLFVRLSPPGTPGKWTDAATGEHGDLLDLVRLATGSASLRETLAEARRFLALPAAAPRSTDAAKRTFHSRCGGARLPCSTASCRSTSGMWTVARRGTSVPPETNDSDPVDLM